MRSKHDRGAAPAISGSPVSVTTPAAPEKPDLMIAALIIIVTGRIAVPPFERRTRVVSPQPFGSGGL
jgi:hypothetical protein